MALQAGVQTSKVLILVGAGVSGSIILRSGKLSELIGQLQELLKGVDGNETSTSLPYKYDSAALAAQIRQLAQEIKELTMSNPVTIFNGNSASNGGVASYLVPAAAVGAMGYCYMWWKGWSFSDVMYVTKNNMASAVTSVSKQLDHVSETLASTKRHLSKRLETLDWKLEEQHETSKLIANDVSEMKSSLSQIGFDVESIHRMISGLEGKIGLLESKQDVTNAGLWYLCQATEGIQNGLDTQVIQDIGAKLAIDPDTTQATSLKGLKWLAETDDTSGGKLLTATRKNDLNNFSDEKIPLAKTRIHRSFPVGISWAHNTVGSRT